MNEYLYDIFLKDGFGEWKIKDTGKIGFGYNEEDAQGKAEIATSRIYSSYRVRNLKLVKKFTNPDKEI